MTQRCWKKEGDRHWRCAPWSICLCFVDGCSMYVLSKDGVDQAVSYEDELADAMKTAKQLEEV